MNNLHYSVMLNECIKGLDIKPDGIYVDGTLGMGGHSEKIAEKLETGRLIAIDRDESAIERASRRLEEYKDKITYIHSDFRELPSVLDKLGLQKVDGILLDLGVSSPQLDEAERGFSYMHDAPLDMRMDRDSGITAYSVVNTWDKQRLKKIFYEYGEERYAPRIADAIEKARDKKEIKTTLELVDIIRSAMPSAALREKQHPAKRTFQAIRIAVNDELGAVEELLDRAVDRLNVGGRLVIISFHSLEDRIVKTAINSRENGCTCPRDFPVCTCGFVRTLRNLTRKPMIPTAQELDENPRSRSAKLRIAEKV